VLLRRLRSLPLLLAALLLASCATLRAYPGAPRGTAQTACLRPALMPARLILLDAVDGARLGWLHDRAELLPGEHVARVTVILRGRDRELEFTHELRFTAEAGRDYVVYAEPDAYGPRTFILDDQAGRIVAETTSCGDRRQGGLAPPTLRSASPRCAPRLRPASAAR
jgi:hypothetical protein